MMTTKLSYRQDLFVGRERRLAQLVDRLLDEESDSKKCRCTIVEGPCGRGKTWLLKRLNEKLLEPANKSKSLVLYLNSENFNQPAPDRQELFKQLLAKPWDEAQQRIKSIPHLQNETLAQINSQAFTAQFLLDKVIFEFIHPLMNMPQPVYFIIIIDGIEEIDVKLLEEFENLFVVPLFKYQNVRLIASRRESSEKPWRRFMVSRQTVFEPLEGFDEEDATNPFTSHWLAQEQLAKYIEKLNNERSAAAQIDLTFADLESQVPNYRWNNPGANACLIDCAVRDNKQITDTCLENCIDLLLGSTAMARPLDEQDKEHLFRLIQKFPNIEQGQNLLNVGKELGMEDRERNDYLGRLKERGIAQLSGFILTTPHEFVALIRKLQEGRP